jgi:hypothetical protein
MKSKDRTIKMRHIHLNTLGLDLLPSSMPAWKGASSDDSSSFFSSFSSFSSSSSSFFFFFAAGCRCHPASAAPMTNGFPFMLVVANSL